jgi:hypothetical protein
MTWPTREAIVALLHAQLPGWFTDQASARMADAILALYAEAVRELPPLYAVAPDGGVRLVGTI